MCRTWEKAAASNINRGNTINDRFRRKRRKQLKLVDFSTWTINEFLEEGIYQQDL